ncbi:MAG TPA: nucleotidyltransferase family protein [Gaiellales bacterium]|nr:nucleotidyltransferase family protein [Gaiellales bacterium]
MKQSEVFELLRRCAVEHDWTRPPDGIRELVRRAGASQVGNAAAEHGVTNILYLATRGLEELDAELRSLLGTVYHLNLTHHMKVIGELTAMSAALDEARIPFMVVKGPVLAEVVYPRNDLRAYGDLDLVIPRASFGDAITVLLESGCDMVDRNWRVIRREMRGQLHMTARFGTSVDVHWHLLNRSAVRRSFDVDMDALFARARSVSLDGPTVLTLDSPDTLLQLALHAALSGGSKLAWLKDIDRAAADPGLDWDEVVRRAETWRVGPVAAVSLRRSAQLLNAPVPEEVLERLAASRVWQGIIRGSERLSPAGRPPNQPSLSRSVTRATRDSLATSLRALTGRFAIDVRDRLGGIVGRRRAIVASGGDDSDRMAYFEAVRGGGRAAAEA